MKASLTRSRLLPGNPTGNERIPRHSKNHNSPRSSRFRRRGFRRLAMTTLIFGIITLVAGTQFSRVLAPHWAPIRHVIVNCGGQLLALGGLFALALEVDKMRHHAGPNESSGRSD